MNTVIVIGARPNFMKAIPVYNALKQLQQNVYIVHTGQHYSKNLSEVFLNDFNIKDIIFLNKKNDYSKMSDMNIFSDILVNFTNFITDFSIEKVVVFGDINSTLACGLVASSMKKILIHVEAGLRCYDMNMAEEKNRVLIDKLSDLLFVTEKNAICNLQKEDIYKNIYHFGNTMIDTLQTCVKKISYSPKNYILLTIHRKENVNNKNNMVKIFKTLTKIQEEIIFICHPKTKKVLEEHKISIGKIKIIEPQSYMSMLKYMYNSKLVITDSGGLQEETSYLGVPCITIRENTERPITIEHGTNILIQPSKNNFEELILKNIKDCRNKKVSSEILQEMGSGDAGYKIAQKIYDF